MFSDIQYVADEDFLEMVVTDDGESWVNFWGLWSAVLKAASPYPDTQRQGRTQGAGPQIHFINWYMIYRKPLVQLTGNDIFRANTDFHYASLWRDYHGWSTLF